MKGAALLYLLDFFIEMQGATRKRKVNSNKSGFQNLSGKRLFFLVTALVCILMTSAVAIILLNRIVVGGASYNYIKKSTEAIENITIINSDLYQILNEVRPIMHDADKGSAITMARLLTLDIDKRFVTLQDLVRSSGRKEVVNKVDLIWKEYKKTLMEEIIPASAKGDKLKIAYLTTGIQSQRFNSISKNMATLTANLRQDITQTELQAASDKNVNIAITAFLTAILLCITAYLQRITSGLSVKQLQQNTELTGEISAEKTVEQPTPKDVVNTVDLPEIESDIPLSALSRPLTQHPIPEALIRISCELADTSARTGSFLSEQETAVNNLSEQTDHIVQSSRHLASDLAKLDSWSSNNQAAAVNMISTNQETALTTDQLEKDMEQLHTDVSDSATMLKSLHTHLCNLQNIVCNTASSSVYMDAGIKLLHSNSLESVNNLQFIGQNAETGRQLIDDAINSICELRAASQITTDAVEKLSLKTRTINSLNSTIAEMAEQTKLLAFNATIIATQTGEQGNNFAVVADEIKYLAERTSSATLKISNIITGMQKETHLTVDSICKSEANIIKGEQLSQRSSMVLNDIIKGISQTNAQIQKIADAASIRAGESHVIREDLNNLVKLFEDTAESTGGQSDLFAKLILSTDHIKQTTAVIRSEAHDQLSRSCIITNAAEELCNLNNEMQETGFNLYKQSETVSATVTNMGETTTKAAAAATTTKESAEELAKQIDILKADHSCSGS